MAKKAVASLQTGSKKLAKAIKMVKKDGSSSYSFEERILPQDLVNDWLAGKPLVKKVFINLDIISLSELIIFFILRYISFAVQF